jgi:hypothetical protein
VDGDGVPYKNFAGIRVAARFQAMVPSLSAFAHASRESFPLEDTLVVRTALVAVRTLHFADIVLIFLCNDYGSL